MREVFADRRPSLALCEPLARLAASALPPSTSERGRRSGSEGRDRLTLRVRIMTSYLASCRSGSEGRDRLTLQTRINTAPPDNASQRVRGPGSADAGPLRIVPRRLGVSQRVRGPGSADADRRGYCIGQSARSQRVRGPGSADASTRSARRGRGFSSQRVRGPGSADAGGAQRDTPRRARVAAGQRAGNG